MEQTTAAEQRAFAVAKLKRAASLPRMKDGRRPPMHVEAVSEGEKSQVEDKAEEPKNPEGDQPSEGVETVYPPSDQALEPPPTNMQSYQPNERAVGDPEEVPVISTTPDSAAAAEKKRRRRSRSRSRGSKDLKNKLKVVTPSLPTVQATNDSSQDEDVPPQNSSPPLVSPKPFRFDLMPSPYAEANLYPPTSPSTPMLPSLEALRSGLFRSNSASSGVQRAMAMAKLTGETFDPAAVVTNTPFAKLSRNNTVAGGERMAARALLFHRLGERLNTDAEQTSAGEEVTTQATPAKRKRRRKKRSSSRASTVVDDREPSSTAPTTPVLSNSTLAIPINTNQLAEVLVHRPPSATRSRTPVNIENGVEYQTPLHNRGVVIEDEDEPLEQSPPLPIGLPQTPQRSHLGRLPHVSDAPSNFSTDSAPGIGVPFFLSQQKHLLRPDVFPTSPFATPLKEKAYLEDEDDTFAEVRRVPLPTNEREPSWVEPSKAFFCLRGLFIC